MNKYLKISIFALLATFSCNLEVNAATITASELKWEGENILKVEDGSVGNTYMHSFVVNDGGKEYGAFCVDYGAQVPTSSDTVTTYPLANHFSSTIGTEKANQLAKKLNEYTHFGYGTNGRNSTEYFLATQKLIWDEIFASGFYGTSVSNLQYTYNGGWPNIIDITSEINTIKSDISKYYITPSFCSSNVTLEIAVGETVSYPDNNGVLSQYEVTCGEGLTCEKNGNNLNVTAVTEGADKTITLTKPKNGTSAIVYSVSSDVQAVIPSGGEMGPVSCNFGIDTYKNQQTSDIKIVTIILIGILCGIASYIIYKSKRMLNELK